MVFLPLSQAVTAGILPAIRVVATDMDGTLTIEGKFTATLMQAFTDLAAMGREVVIVTGRSAGWVSGLAHYLPIAGAICENGGLFYSGQTDSPIPLTPIADFSAHRLKLAAMFNQLQQYFPGIEESDDNRFRLTDWTFDVQNLSDQTLEKMAHLCADQGWSFTYSTVQCHIKPAHQDKAIGLQQVLTHHLSQSYQANQVLTIGDSPNDESLFNPAYFPYSIGVANLAEYRDRLTHLPTYVTLAAEGRGFCELVAELKKF